MPERQRIEYSQLETGYEFPASSFKLDTSIVATYLRAVEETGSLYQDTGVVPATAIAAYAMAALSENISLPPGAIHISQRLEFLDIATVNDTLVSSAKVSRKQSRGKFNFLTVDINVCNQRQKIVLVGETSFILPERDESGGE